MSLDSFHSEEHFENKLGQFIVYQEMTNNPVYELVEDRE